MCRLLTKRIIGSPPFSCQRKERAAPHLSRMVVRYLDASAVLQMAHGLLCTSRDLRNGFVKIATRFSIAIRAEDCE